MLNVVLHNIYLGTPTAHVDLTYLSFDVQFIYSMCLCSVVEVIKDMQQVHNIKLEQ
jgi:hypothetical protein